MATNGTTSRFASPADPAGLIPGAPPNFGRAILPHVTTFPDQIYQLARVYRAASDQAIRYSRENALNMRQDLTVMSCLKARQRAVALLDWSVSPEDKRDPKQKAWCQRLTAILHRTNRFTRMRQWLQEAIWFGRCAVNPCFGWDQAQGQKCMAVRAWQPVHGDKLVFRHDIDGRPGTGQVGIRVAPQALGADFSFTFGGNVRRAELANDYGYAYFLEPWERSLLCLHQHEIEDAAYEDGASAGAIHGIGIRSQIYQTWVLKQETLGALVDFIDRVGQGFTVAYYEDGNPQSKAAVEDMAKNYDGRRWILFPKPLGDDRDVYRLERIEPSAAGIDALRTLLDDYFGDNMMRFILGQTLTMKAEATGIGSGATDAHRDSFYQVIKFDATNAEESLTAELLEPLKTFNIPEARNCNLRLSLAVDSPKVKDQLEALERAWKMGKKLPGRQVSELVGIAEPEPGDEILQDPQFAQQQGQGGPGQPPGADPDRAAAMSRPFSDQAQEALERLFGVEAGPGAAAVARYRKGEAPRAAELAGRLFAADSGWGMLEIPNDLVRGAFDALEDPTAVLPLQSDGRLNAHISVFRPEELDELGGLSAVQELGQVFAYQLGAVKEVDPAGWQQMEKCWFIEVDSPALEDLRESYGLSRLPNGGKYRFHITFAVRPAKGSKLEKYAKALGAPEDGEIARDAIAASLPEAMRERAQAIPVRWGEAGAVSWDGETITIPQGDDVGPSVLHGLALALGVDLAESRPWKDAWQAEISGGQLTEFAQAGPVEGLTEFARLAWSDKVAATGFPQCTAAFVEAGLLDKPKTPAKYAKSEGEPAQPKGDRVVKIDLHIPPDVHHHHVTAGDVHVQAPPPAQVNVAAPNVSVAAPSVTVQAPPSPPPIVVPAPRVEVNVPPAPAPVVEVLPAPPAPVQQPKAQDKTVRMKLSDGREITGTIKAE